MDYERARRDDCLQRLDRAIPLLLNRTDAQRDGHDRSVRQHGAQKGQDGRNAVLLYEEVGLFNESRSAEQCFNGRHVDIDWSESGFETSSGRREWLLALPEVIR